MEDEWSAAEGASDWVDMERAGGGGWREGVMPGEALLTMTRVPHAVGAPVWCGEARA